MTVDYIEAHEFSSNHKEQLLNDKKCGCFHCLSIFSPCEITEWVNDKSGTGLCPYCGIDSIIGESSGFPITNDFLEKMNLYWSRKQIHKFRLFKVGEPLTPVGLIFGRNGRMIWTNKMVRARHQD